MFNFCQTMPLRRTRVFGERQFVRVYNGSLCRIQIVKILVELFFEGTPYTFTIKLTRRVNLVNHQVTSTSTITSTIF